MPLRDIEAEDIALLVSVSVAAAAVLVDEVYGSTAFKALKILALLLSLGLAVHRIRSGKPFYKDFPASSWVKAGERFELVVPRSEHKRGKHPSARCLTKNEAGTYGGCYAEATNRENGDLLLRANQAFDLRVEVRK
jgi:hypothetical protein